MRDDFLKYKILTDTHALNIYRFYMPLKKKDAFYNAFNVKERDKMHLKLEERIKIWF